jgi:hypothetical protein
MPSGCFTSKLYDKIIKMPSKSHETIPKPAFIDHFGGRKSEDFAENPLPRISMFTSSRCWSDFGRIFQQIRGFQIDYECGLYK